MPRRSRCLLYFCLFWGWSAVFPSWALFSSAVSLVEVLLNIKTAFLNWQVWSSMCGWNTIILNNNDTQPHLMTPLTKALHATPPNGAWKHRRTHFLRNNFKCLFNRSKKGNTQLDWKRRKEGQGAAIIIGQYYDFSLILTLIRIWLKRKHVFCSFLFL